MGGACLDASLSNTPNHSLLPVRTAASAPCVKVKRTFFGQICCRRRYDPAASCMLSSTAPSLRTARLQERREGSHLRAAVQFVAVAGIRISFQLLAEIPGIFFFFLGWLYLLLSLKLIPLLVSRSPAGCVWLFLHEYFQKCVSAAGKRDFTSGMNIFASWHTFRRPIVFSGWKSAGPTA